VTRSGHHRAAWNLVLWVSGVTCLLRVGIVFVLEVLLRSEEPIFTAWRIAQDLPLTALHAWLAGGATVLAAIVARRGSALRWLLVLLAALLLVSALGGWPWGETDQIPTWRTTRGRGAILVAAFLALVTTTGVWWLLRRIGRGDTPSQTASVPVTGGGFLVAIVLPATLYLVFVDAPQRREVDVVIHELAFEPERWEILHAREDAPPGTATLTPSLDYREDGGDLPALTLTPPCEVAIDVPEGSGSMLLKGRSGVDVSAARMLAELVGPVSVRIRITVDGALVAGNVHTFTGEEDESAGRLWQDLHPAHGIAVDPGQVIALRSEVIAPADLDPAIALPAGIGDLVLERRASRRHVSSSPEAPNIVLIVLDTLRRDRLSCYGYELETTPNIDSLAERGLLYEDAYATSSWTWPSTASILTGLHPETHGVLEEGDCYLHHSFETLPELLAERNFATGAISCNPLVVPNKNFDQGFEHFDHHYLFRHSQQVISDIQDWIRMHAGKRFFLYLQLTDPHEQYAPLPEATARAGGQRPGDYPEAGLNEWHLDLLANAGHDEAGRLDVERLIKPEHQEWMHHAYDAAVITADHFVGVVLEELRALGLEDRTVIAFTSDHGEELLDHGLVTHGITLHPELLRVPLILAGPGVPQARRVEGPVSNRHLAPTLASIGNAVFSTERHPLDLAHPDELAQTPVFFSTKQGWWNGHFRTELYGMRLGKWELHWAPHGSDWGSKEGPEGGQLRLYDLEADPEQREDLVDGQHERVLEIVRRGEGTRQLRPDDEPLDRAADLLVLLRAHLKYARSGRPGSSVGAGKRDRHGLESLGYSGRDDERARGGR